MTKLIQSLDEHAVLKSLLQKLGTGVVNRYAELLMKLVFWKFP